MDTGLKQKVKEFYNQVGWQKVGDQLYQNAIYEDLRPVSREYIQRCHLRVNRHIQARGKFLLDAGSGPVQWPEYLTYSQGYKFRVCLDLSIVALKEARMRMGEKGLYIVADVTSLPFADSVFKGVVSLHTFHHLSTSDQKKAFHDLNRVLLPTSSAVVVNGYSVSPLMQRLSGIIKLGERLTARKNTKEPEQPKTIENKEKDTQKVTRGTFVEKYTFDWIQNSLADLNISVFPWRSVSVRFMRALVHPHLGGKYLMRLIYWLEERFPAWFAKNGQYPMVVIQKEK